MTLANKITLFRILTIPILIIGLLLRAPVWPAALFLLSAATDVLDGLAARWRGENSVLGGFLDPLADKLMLGSIFLTLVQQDRAPMWVFVLVFSRDLLIFLGWNILFILTRDWKLSPRPLGRSATFLQFVSAGLILVPFPADAAMPAVLGVMTAVTFFSMADYLWLGARRLGEWS